MRQAQFFPRAPQEVKGRGQVDGTLQKLFTQKQEDGELHPSDKMGSQAQRAGEPACTEHRVRKGEGPI